MTIKHSLYNQELDKIFNIELLRGEVLYEIGKKEKLRSYKKTFKSEEDALKFFYKKEWEILKKGFILSNETEIFGTHKLHYFVGIGYTGALSFEDTPKGIFVYKHGSYEDVRDSYDFIIHIDRKGNLKNTIKLPEVLPWDIKYNSINNLLLMVLNHHIYSFNIETDTFKKIADKEKGKWASFISVSENLYSYGTNEKLFVKNLEDEVLFTQPYEVEIIKGNSPFCAITSKTQNSLALHNKIGEINIIDIENKKRVKEIKEDFDIVSEMEFIESENILVVKEYYPKPLRFFDINEGKQIEFPSLEIPEYTKEVNDFCFNKEQSKLVLRQRETMYVFDFIAKKMIGSFKIAHMVKTAKIKFIGEDLGVRTDYGCFSLYKV